MSIPVAVSVLEEEIGVFFEPHAGHVGTGASVSVVLEALR